MPGFRLQKFTDLIVLVPDPSSPGGTVNHSGALFVSEGGQSVRFRH